MLKLKQFIGQILHEVFGAGKKAVQVGAVTLACSIPAHAQHGPGVDDKEIRLGTWITLTGPGAVYGVPFRAGIDAYFASLNDRGGVNGRKIKLIVEDNAYNPQKTVAAARKLISRDEVLAIAMPFGAPSAAAFDYVLGESKVPMMNIYGSAQEWFDPPKPGLFGAMVLYEKQAQTIGRWLVKDGLKSTVVIYSGMAGFVNVATQIEPGVKSLSGSFAVELMPTKFGTTDYAPIALDVTKKNPDAVVMLLSQTELLAAAKELRQQGYKGAFYTYSPSVSNATLELGGTSIEGIKAIGLTQPVNSDTSVMRQYRDALNKYAPSEKADYQSLMGYALAMVTAESLRRIQGPITREALVKSLYSIRDFETGIFPPISYTPSRHLGVTRVHRVVAKGGQWIALGGPIDSEKDW